MKNITPVIFRKFKDGEIIALFPTLPGDWLMCTCLSYLHVGQHGPADLGIIRDTSPAAPEEYKDLLAELVSIGYDDLRVYQKYLNWMRYERWNALKEWSK